MGGVVPIVRRHEERDRRVGLLGEDRAQEDRREAQGGGQAEQPAAVDEHVGGGPVDDLGEADPVVVRVIA